MAQIKYVAIGDSFTEGVGDELPDGSVRGWADLTAQGLADAAGEPILYANLAIRGRLLDPILAEQLGPALALEPTLVSVNGGGNDMLRPGTDLGSIIAKTEVALRRIADAGAEPLLLAGANPTGGLPLGGSVARKGDALTAAAAEVAGRLGLRFADNWSDHALAQPQYWSRDRLHLAAVGHHRVAARVLETLGRPVPADWVTVAATPLRRATAMDHARFAREHVAPWVQRRLTGRSSGDGRAPKFAAWTEVHPRPAG